MAFLTNLFANINKKEKWLRVKNSKQKATICHLSLNHTLQTNHQPMQKKPHKITEGESISVPS